MHPTFHALILMAWRWAVPPHRGPPQVRGTQSRGPCSPALLRMAPSGSYSVVHGHLLKVVSLGNSRRVWLSKQNSRPLLGYRAPAVGKGEEGTVRGSESPSP